MAGCRDCSKCTRPGIIKLLILPFTLLYGLLLSWNIGLFIRKCPQCRHALRYHHRRIDGSFKD